MAAFTNKRTAHRWRLLMVMLGGVFAACGSFWLLQAMRGADDASQAGARSSEPDYIVENFSFVRMSESGQPRYVVSGKRLAHRPIDDVSEVEEPVMQSITTEHPRVTMHATSGRVLHGQNQVDLIGNVAIDRPGTPTAQPLHVRTEMLTVLPDEEIIKTGQPIDMKLGRATVRSTGMELNNATQQLHLSSHSQIIYPPRAER